MKYLLKFFLTHSVHFKVELQDDPNAVSQSISIRNKTLYMFGGVVLDEPCNYLYTLNLGEQNI